MVKSAELRHRATFRGDRCKMAPPAIWDFSNSEIVTVETVKRWGVVQGIELQCGPMFNAMAALRI